VFNPFKNPFNSTVSRVNFSQIKAQCFAMAVRKEPWVEPTGGIYTKFASQVFGVPEDNITPAMRKAAKKRLICRLYGGS